MTQTIALELNDIDAFMFHFIAGLRHLFLLASWGVYRMPDLFEWFGSCTQNFKGMGRDW